MTKEQLENKFDEMNHTAFRAGMDSSLGLYAPEHYVEVAEAYASTKVREALDRIEKCNGFIDSYEMINDEIEAIRKELNGE